MLSPSSTVIWFQIVQYNRKLSGCSEPSFVYTIFPVKCYFNLNNFFYASYIMKNVEAKFNILNYFIQPNQYTFTDKQGKYICICI